jgi:YVTN family beta-propeller protein
VTRIDPRSSGATLLGAIEPGGAGGVAVGDGSVWVAGVGTSNENDVLWRIDPHGEFASASLPVGAGPSGVAVGAGSIWVANRLDGTVSRIDPSANQVVATIKVGGAPSDIAVGAGAVWVTVG